MARKLKEYTVRKHSLNVAVGSDAMEISKNRVITSYIIIKLV